MFLSLHGISLFSCHKRVPINIHMLDNESRAALKSKIIVIGFIFQLFPPGLILENNIEQEIQTPNGHFLMGV